MAAMRDSDTAQAPAQNIEVVVAQAPALAALAPVPRLAASPTPILGLPSVCSEKSVLLRSEQDHLCSTLTPGLALVAALLPSGLLSAHTQYGPASSDELWGVVRKLRYVYHIAMSMNSIELLSQVVQVANAFAIDPQSFGQWGISPFGLGFPGKRES